MATEGMMGEFLNPQGENEFIELVRNRHNKVFVDKTKFIGETLKKRDSCFELMAYLGPHNFGKTVMAQMLLAYYAKGDNNKKLFADLDIAKYKGQETNEKWQTIEVNFTTHLNKCDVIYIDMEKVNMLYQKYLAENTDTKVWNLAYYLKSLIIADLKANRKFASILKKANVSDIGLLNAFLAINNANPSFRFVFIMDDYDLVFREYRDDIELQHDFIGVLKVLFKGGSINSIF